MSKTIAIMQPTYLPWVGFFALMGQVDAFVFLDSVQFDRRSWQQRNRIRTKDGEQMLTVPVFKKGKRAQTIAEVEIDHDGAPLEKHARAIALAYAKAPCIAGPGRALLDILSRRHRLLVDLNLDIIDWARSVLGISTPCLRSSTLSATGCKADLLAAICVELGADHYLSPPGSRDYLDASTAMTDVNVSVEYFAYECQPYSQQHGDFVPYLSVADLILNHGPDAAAIMRAGVRPAPPAA